MALLSLNIRNRSIPSSRDPANSSSALRLSFPKVDRPLLPGRGIVFSVLAHGLAVGLILFGPIYYSASARVSTKDLEAEEASAESQVIYLPRLGGGSEGKGYEGGGSIIRRKGSATTPTRSSPGVSYPGPQAILSDPPQPTNKFQTIMRPALKNPPVLSAFVSAPNIVQTANAGPLPELESKEPARPNLALSELKPNMPKAPSVKISEPAPTFLPPTTDLAKLTLPTAAPQRPAPPDMKIQAPKAPTLQADGARAPQFSPVPTRGPDLQTLLSLSPAPAPPAPSANLPDGEARGRFAISPDSTPASSQPQPGSKSTGSAASDAAPVSIGNDLDARPGNAVSEGESGVSNGSARSAIGGNGGLGTNTGNGVGSGSGGRGGGDGRGSATGTGLGTGEGLSSGADAGAGAATGGGNFRGITIGPGPGSLDPRFAVSMVYPVPIDLVSKLRKNTFIVSAGSTGGGGLDVYGALNCAKIYTIFLPMPGANWTMQYCQEAVAGAAASPPADPYSAVVHLQPGLVPPDPNADSRYDFQRLPVPPEKANKMIVLKGVLREDGSVDALQVYRGIVPQMDEAARIAFGRWKFKPAMREGKPVAVDVLVGIPSDVPPEH